MWGGCGLRVGWDTYGVVRGVDLCCCCGGVQFGCRLEGGYMGLVSGTVARCVGRGWAHRVG
jgi:hypothetical protein